MEVEGGTIWVGEVEYLIHTLFDLKPSCEIPQLLISTHPSLRWGNHTSNSEDFQGKKGSPVHEASSRRIWEK